MKIAPFKDSAMATAMHTEAQTDAELIAWLRKASSTIYLATEASVADDLSPKLVKAAARIEALTAAEATAWQGIESAPTGEEDFFLVCGVGDDRSAFVVRGTILHSARKANTPSHLHLHWLTHWRPLPAPPKEGGT